MAALTGLSLALMAGCKTGEPHPEPSEVTAPPATNPVVVATNTTTAPKSSPPSDSSDSMAPDILAWDAVSKEYHARPSDTIAPFSFSLTNVSPKSVVIYDTSTSCDCTVAKLPSTPWIVPSGGSGTIDATVKIPNKGGVVETHVIVFTSQGNRRLTLRTFATDGK